MLLSRHQPPRASARRNANNLLTVMDNAALRFTPAKSCVMAALQGNAQAARLERAAPPAVFDSAPG